MRLTVHLLIRQTSKSQIFRQAQKADSVSIAIFQFIRKVNVYPNQGSHRAVCNLHFTITILQHMLLLYIINYAEHVSLRRIIMHDLRNHGQWGHQSHKCFHFATKVPQLFFSFYQNQTHFIANSFLHQPFSRPKSHEDSEITIPQQLSFIHLTAKSLCIHFFLT